MRFALLCITPKTGAVRRYIRQPQGRVWLTDECELEKVEDTTIEELERFRLAPPREQVTGVFA